MSDGKPKLKYTLYTNKPKFPQGNWFFQKVLWLDSRLARQVLSRPERGTAADMEYLRNGKSCRKGFFLGLLDWIFIRSKAGKSIATRTVKVQSLIRKYLEFYVNQRGRTIEILCLGCGDGIEVAKPVYEMKNNNSNIKVSATLIDIDPDAIHRGRRLVKNIDWTQISIIFVKTFLI